MFQIDVQRLVGGYVRVVDQHARLERPRGVDVGDQRVAVVGQLHHRAGRIDAHHADERIEHRRVELAARLREDQRQRLVRRQRLRGLRGVAQVVVAVDQGHDARCAGHAVDVQVQRKAAAIGHLVVLADHQQRTGCEPHALALCHATGHMLAVQAHVGRRRMRVDMVHPIGQLQLADVVQQRADADVEHLALAEAEHAAHQHGNHRHIERVRRRSVALHLRQHADAHLAIEHHLVQQRARQPLGGLAGELRLPGHLLGSRLPRACRLVVLAGAHLVCFALGTQLLAALACALLLRRLVRRRRCNRADRGGLGRFVLPVVERALFGTPTHLVQPEAANGCDLLGRGDLEARQRERMGPPREVEVDEHSDTKLVDADAGRHLDTAAAAGRDGWPLR